MLHPFSYFMNFCLTFLRNTNRLSKLATRDDGQALVITNKQNLYNAQILLSRQTVVYVSLPKTNYVF